GLDRATARRVLLTLQERKYVRQVGDRYTLAARVLGFGYGYLSSIPFWELARPVMEDLVRAIKESSSAAVLDGDEAVYVARVRSQSRLVDVTRTVGSRIPAYCTSLGRVLLAGLPSEERQQRINGITLTRYTEHTITSKKKLLEQLEQVAEQGWCLVNQEMEVGLTSIAVPLHDADGKVCAALNVSFQVPRIEPDVIMNRLLPALKNAAEEIDLAARARAQRQF